MIELVRKLIIIANSLDKKGEYAIASQIDELASNAFLFKEDEPYSQEDVPNEALQIVPQTPESSEETFEQEPTEQIEIEETPKSFEGGEEKEGPSEGLGGEKAELTNSLDEATEIIQILQDAGYSNEKLMQLVESI